MRIGPFLFLRRAEYLRQIELAYQAGRIRGSDDFMIELKRQRPDRGMMDLIYGFDFNLAGATAADRIRRDTTA